MNRPPLMRYDAACRAIAEAVSIDEAKDIRDQYVAIAAYARQAKNHSLEADAVAIRMRATRRMDQMRQAQKESVGLATGGEYGGRAGIDGSRKNPTNARPTLASQGIDKNLPHEGRKLGALTDEDFELKVAEMRGAVTSTVGKIIKSITLPRAERDAAEIVAGEITLAQWKTMSAEERRECLKYKNFPSDVRFNKQESDGIEWAKFSWPSVIVGCKHPCRIYCWANDVTLRFPNSYPHGFDPVFRPRMLNAPRNTPVPPEAASDWRFKNVFTVDMGDMFGGWIPWEWIEAILTVVRENPRWRFLFLTKFPKRMTDFEFPENVWLGTTIDWQVRVPSAEAAFAKLRAKNPHIILFASVEPMFEPIRFNQPELFNWLIIGGASRSMRTPEFRPPGRWINDLEAQADTVGCKIYEKTNLRGNRILELPFDAPIKHDYPQVAPEVFHYLKRVKAEP